MSKFTSIKKNHLQNHTLQWRCFYGSSVHKNLGKPKPKENDHIQK